MTQRTDSAARIVLLDDLGSEARRVIEVCGPDAERFLQGLLSADLRDLDANMAVPAALLTVKGKLVSDAVVVPRGDDMFLLVVPRDQAEAVHSDLDRHVIMDDVTLTLRGDLSAALAWGGDEAPAGEGVIVAATRHPAPGWLVLGTSAALETVASTRARADADTWAAYRIDTASPAWGRECTPDRFPPEVGYVHGVSYDKGCYRGQEPLARIHARSQVNWVMVRVTGHGEVGGTPVELAAETREQAGRLTTFVRRDGGGVGLAVVHRSVAVVGTELRGGGGTVTVQSEPLGDDPGIGA